MKQFARRSKRQAGASLEVHISDHHVHEKVSQEPADPYSFPDDHDDLATAGLVQPPTIAASKAPAVAQPTTGVVQTEEEAPVVLAAVQRANKSPFDFESDCSDGSPPKRARAADITSAATAPSAAAGGASDSGGACKVATGSKPSLSQAAVKSSAPAAGTTTAGTKRAAPPLSPPRPAAAAEAGGSAAGKSAAVAARTAAAAAALGGGASGNSRAAVSGSSRRPGGTTSQAASGRVRKAAAAAAGSGQGRAASGGRAADNGRTASGGKHSATGSPNCTETANGIAAAAAAHTQAPATDRQAQQAAAVVRKPQSGSRTPSVSLPTPRRPAGLIAAAGLFAAAEARPAQTVMEAQERGELVQLQDDARYAMDGLAPSCSIDTQRDSAVALTEMLCSRRGRMALRADGLAQQVLSCLAKLKACKDCVLGLAATIVLLMLTSEDAHPTYLASVAAAVLMDQLLQCNHTFEEASSCGAPGAKLAKLLKARPLCSLLASTRVTTQRELLLITLEQATSSQQTSKVTAVERLKHNLRQYGALERLAKLAAAAAGDAVQQARQLHLLLLVLENATFTCQPNGQALAQLQVAVSSSASIPVGEVGSNRAHEEEKQLQPFPAVLVATAQQLLCRLDDEECQAALHVCLSVLMNLSHQNPEGAARISDAGGLQAAAATVSQLLGPAQDSHTALCKQVLKHLELISVALGVLINLVSGEPGNSRKLASIGAPPAGGSSSSMDDASQQQEQQQQGLLGLLCTVMTAVGRLLEQQQEEMDAAEQQQAGGSNGDHSSNWGVGCARGAAADTLSGGEHPLGSPTGSGVLGGAADSSIAGEASIVEVYCGMLLGFIVRDCADLAEVVAQQLEGASLQPIVCAVQRCLNFYVSTGAITEHTRTTLEELLQHLSS